MPLAVGGTLNTNKQINKRKTKNILYQYDVLLDNKYGNGSVVNLIELEAQKLVPGIRKRNKSLSYHMTSNQSNIDKNLIPVRNCHISNALNLISYSICISSTLAAILMTSSFAPEAELR